MNVSIYNGSGAKETIPANIDLDAPNGEPLVEFKKIVDTTAKKLDKKLREKLKLKNSLKLFVELTSEYESRHSELCPYEPKIITKM